MSSACDFCRRRKLKCSKLLPKCSSCIKFNRECVYTPRQKPAPLTKAYVQQLQRRIILLESALSKSARPARSGIEIERLLENDQTLVDNSDIGDISPNGDFNFPPNRIESGIEESPDSVNSDSLKAEDFILYEDFYNVDDLDWYEEDPTSINDKNFTSDKQICDKNPEKRFDTTNGLIDGMGALSLGGKSGFIRNHSFYGISSSNGLLRFLKSSDNNNKMDNNNLDKQDSNMDFNPNNLKLLESENSDILLNDPSFRNELVMEYFDSYHCCYPFIKKSTFLQEFKTFKEGSWKILKMRNPIKEISFQVLLNTILAIGAFCKYGERSIIDLLYYKRVKLTLQEINMMECGSYQLLSAFILLGNYVQKRNKPNTGWNYNGLSLRMAISFGLHKEVNAVENSNNHSPQFLEILERRRRLFWGLFFFDVGLAITFGRPLHLPILESIDIKYPLNVEDTEIENLGDGAIVGGLVKSYPTIYAGIQQEAKLSKISYKIYNYITKVSGSNVEILISKMSHLIVLNNLIIEFAKSLPPYFAEDNAKANKYIGDVCPSTWFKINIDGTLSIPKWFNLTRRRIIWRSKNLQILMFRSFIWESADFFGGSDTNSNFHSDLRLNNLLDLCMDNCYKAAKDTIYSISDFVLNCEIDIISSWYATYFIFQAVLIPILLLYKKYSKLDHADLKLLLHDIEVTKESLTSLKVYNNLAKSLVDTIEFLTEPIIENLNKENQINNCNKNKNEVTNEMNNRNFDFTNLPSATINLFSNVGVDFKNSTTGSNLFETRFDHPDQSIPSGHEIDGNQSQEECFSSEETISNFLQQELFPIDPIPNTNLEIQSTHFNFQDLN